MRKVRMMEKGQGATEYLLMLAAVLIIVAIAVYYVTSAGGYPTISATATPLADGDNVGLKVYSGSIPAGEWAYVIDQDATSDAAWKTGTFALNPDSPSLENLAPGTWYVSLKHVKSGHVYFSNQPVTLSK